MLGDLNTHARFEEARTIVHGHNDVYEYFDILFWKVFLVSLDTK